MIYTCWHLWYPMHAYLFSAVYATISAQALSQTLRVYSAEKQNNNCTVLHTHTLQFTLVAWSRWFYPQPKPSHPAKPHCSKNSCSTGAPANTPCSRTFPGQLHLVTGPVQASHTAATGPRQASRITAATVLAEQDSSDITAAVALAEQGDSDNGVINPEVPPRF